jgi:hypothetical protein
MIDHQGGVNSSCYPLNNSSTGRGVGLLRYVPSQGKMISFVLADRFINSLAELYYKAGVMTLAVMQVELFQKYKIYKFEYYAKY